MVPEFKKMLQLHPVVPSQHVGHIRENIHVTFAVALEKLELPMTMEINAMNFFRNNPSRFPMYVNMFSFGNKKSALN